MKRFAALALFFLVSLPMAHSAQNDPAPLPDDVISRLVREPFQKPSDGLAQEVMKQLDQTEGLIKRWDEEVKSGHPANVDRAVQLQAQTQVLNSLAGYVKQRLGERQSQADAVTKSKKARTAIDKTFASQAAQVQARFDKLGQVLADVQKADTTAKRQQALGQARDLLFQIRGKYRQREEAPSSIPWPTAQMGGDAGPSPREAVDAIPRYLTQQHSRYMNSVASNGSIILAAAPATPTEASQCYSGSVDPADLAATLDVQKDDIEIAALAQTLGYSPGKILAWVHDNIKYEPYWGSLKGAKGTLIAGAGNATDQSSLMIALLRASNIPARYVTGVIQIADPVPTQPDGRALRWLGTKTYLAAAAVLSQGGIPVSYGSSFLQLDHVWVEACVPYSDYRGVAVTNAGHRWVPLDGAFKDKAYRQDIDVPNVSFDYSFNSGSYLSARTGELPQEHYARQVEAALPSDKDMADLSPEGPVKTMKLDILPASLPYIVTSFAPLTGTTSVEPSALPAEHRFILDVTLKSSGGTTLLSRSVSYPDAALKRLTLSFAPADATSQTWWNSWDGSFAHLPTGGTTVNVKPVVKLEGVEVTGAAAGAVSLTGGNLKLILKLRLPDSNWVPQCVGDSGGTDTDVTCVNKTVYDNIKPGGYHALQAYAFQGFDRYLRDRTQQLIDAVRANAVPTPANPAAYEATLGEFLHLSLVKYMRHLQDSSKQIGDEMNVAGWRGNDIGLTTVDLKTQYLTDLPYALQAGGLLIDVRGGRARFTKLDTVSNDSNTRRNEIWPAFKLALYAGSAYEHYTWQEMVHTDAVSTVRGLQFANETNIPIITFTTSNIGSYSTLTDSSMAGYQPQIANFVSDGATVTVPKTVLSYTAQGTSNVWTGAVYMAENQTKGYIGALISGGFYGGYGALTAALPSLSFIYDTPTPIIYLGTNTTFFSSYNSTTLANGNNAYQSVGGDPVNLVTGNFYHVERDLSIPGRGGLPIVFERSYNSRQPKDGPLGFGWTHSFNHYLHFYGVESGNAKVSWMDGTGGEKFFSTTSHTSGNITAGITLTNPSGIFVTFKRETNGTYTIREKNGLTYTFESVNGGTTDTGLKAKLLKITDRNNNTLTLAYNADATLKDVTDLPGRKLAFTYTSGRISQVDFKNTGGVVVRTHQYVYDGVGNLQNHKSPATLIDPAKNPPVTYQYYTSADGTNLNHAMHKYILPRGNGMEFHYYLDGRVFKHLAFGTAGEDLGQQNSFTYNDYRHETVQVNERGLTRTFLFDGYGNPLSITEENGAYRSYVYDLTNPFNRTKKTDPYGMTTQYAYDTVGNVTQITQPDGVTTVQYLDFNTFNQPRRIKDARGNYHLLKYDASGNLTDVSLKSGIVPVADVTPAPANVLAWRKYSYDIFGNRTGSRTVKNASASPAPSLSNFSSDAGGGLIVSTAFDANSLYSVSIARIGDWTNYNPDSQTVVHDDQGRETSGIDADWQVVQHQYDAVDRVVRATDALGYWRDYAYDANGNAVGDSLTVNSKLVDSNSAIYDGADRRIQALDAAGNASQWTYDSRGNVLNVIDPDGYSLGFEYDAMDRWVVAYDKENNAVKRTLDISGRVRALTDPNNNSKTATWWDASRNGRQKDTLDALARKTTTDWDANGNAIQVTDNAGQVSKTFYDALNRPVRTIAPLVNGSYPVTCTKYDLLGRVIEVWAGSTLDTTSPSCDFTGADTGIKRQLATVYDDFGRKLSDTDPNGKIWSWSYDRNGNPLSTLDPKNQSTVMTWDYGHQLKTRTVKNASGAVYNSQTINRNPLGQPAVIAQTNPTLTETRGYDAAHRLASIKDSRANKTQNYAWSPGGLLNMMLDSDGNRTDYVFDAVGRLIGVWAPNFDYVAFGHDAGGRLTEKWYSNGLTSRYTYNIDDSLASLTNRSASTTVLTSHAYQYDTLGRRVRHTETIGSLGTSYWQYGFDALSRLSSVSSCTSSSYATCTAQETDAYDALDNRISKTAPAGTLAYVYDPANQLTEIHQDTNTGALLTGYVWDANGDLSQKCSGGSVTRSATNCNGIAMMNLTFDPDDRLTSVNLVGSVSEAYAYDSQGRRIAKTASGVTTNYVYQGDDIAAEYGSTWGAPQAVYTHGGGIDDPLVRLTGQTNQPTASATYFHADGLGSVVGMSGATSGVQRFDAWGNKTASSGSAIAQYGYTGREPTDPALGLIYYRARYYDPTIGRFISRDPAGMPDGVNRYEYVGSSPVNMIDPLGLHASDPLLNMLAANEGSYLANTMTDFSAGYQNFRNGYNGNTSVMDQPSAATQLGQAARFAFDISPLGAATDYVQSSLDGHPFSALFALGTLAIPEARVEGAAASGLSDLARFRSDLNLSPSSPGSATLSRLDVGGQSFYGISAHGQGITMNVNAISATHAEADAFQQAINAGVQANTGTLFIDNVKGLCAACGTNGGVKSMMNGLGLDSLTVVTPKGTQVIGR
jgi:RHS repeat-associated protein